MTTMISQKSKQNMNNHRRYQNKTANNKITMKTGCPDMVKGPFGKYDQAFRQTIQHIKGGPSDLTPMTQTLTQAISICASGVLCSNKGTMPLTYRHRCLVCAFAVHVECAKEAEETNKYKKTNGHCDLICKGCLDSLEVKGGEHSVSLGKKPLFWFIRPEYPPLEFSTVDANNDMETESIPQEKAQASDMVTIDINEKAMGETDGDNSVDTAPTKKDSPNKRSTTNTTRKEEIYKGYLNLRLKLEAHPDPTDTTKTFTLVMERCKTWLKAIQDLEPSFKLHTADPAAKAQKILHDLKDFPEKLDDLKSFFKGARPISKGGFLYLKVLGSVQGSAKSFLSSVDWMHRDRKESINICNVQAFETTILGWLLYSHRQLNVERLKEEIQKIEPALKQFDLRFMRISDGKPVGNRDTTDDPRALHLEVSAADSNLARGVFSQVYGSKATAWPRGVRMRWVPAHNTFANAESARKVQHLKNRQAGWNKQLQAKTAYSLVNIEERNLKKGTTSLHKAIMNIYPRSGNLNTTLFFSVEEAWKGGGYVFTYHPDKREEATATIRGLYARMRAQFNSDELMNVFTPVAVEEGQSMKWDPEKNTVISEEDTMIEELMDLDQDMDFGAIQYEKQRTEEPVVVYQRDNFGTDEATMASFSTNKSQLSAPSRKTKRSRTEESIASGSTTSTLTATTKATLESRISKMEVSNKKIEGLLATIVNQIQKDDTQRKSGTQITQDQSPMRAQGMEFPLGMEIQSDAETPERGSAND